LIVKIKDRDGHIVIIDPGIDLYGKPSLPDHARGPVIPVNPSWGEVISIKEAYRRGLLPLNRRRER